MRFITEFRSVALCAYCGFTEQNAGGTAVTYCRAVFRILRVWTDERHETPHSVCVCVCMYGVRGHVAFTLSIQLRLSDQISSGLAPLSSPVSVVDCRCV